MTGTIQNRDSFLNQIASQLGRPRISTKVERPTWKFRPQDEVLKDATQDELLEVLTEQCKKIHTSIYSTDLKELRSTLNEVVSNYGGGPIVTWKDERFSKWGLDSLMKKNGQAKIMMCMNGIIQRVRKISQKRKRQMSVSRLVKSHWRNQEPLYYSVTRTKAGL